MNSAPHALCLKARVVQQIKYDAGAFVEMPDLIRPKPMKNRSIATAKQKVNGRTPRPWRLITRGQRSRMDGFVGAVDFAVEPSLGVGFQIELVDPIFGCVHFPTFTFVSSFSKTTLPVYVDQLAAADPALKRLVQTYGYPAFWHRDPDFATLVKIILEQQVSLASAKAAFDKLEQRIGSVTPEGVLALSDAELRQCYFSRQKTVYVRDLSQRVMNGSLALAQLPTLPDEEIHRQLTAVKGIGQWTVEVYLLLALHRLDVFPLGDLALVKSMQEQRLVRASSGKDQMRKRAMCWRPYRSVAVILLWHAYLTRRNKAMPLPS